jgi:hypothetical protein
MYGYFRLYRDMRRRNKEEVARALSVSSTYIAAMSKAKLWDERVNRYDAWLDTRSLAVTEEAVRNQALVHQQRRDQLLETEWELAVQIQKKVKDLLEKEGDDRNAHRDAAALLREGDRVARLAVQLHTEGGKPQPTDEGMGSDIDAFLDHLANPDESEVSPAPETDPGAAESTD